MELASKGVNESSYSSSTSKILEVNRVRVAQVVNQVEFEYYNAQLELLVSLIELYYFIN